MWGITALWVIVGSLTPVITRNATTSLGITLLLIGPTCCMHIGWLINSRIERVRIANAAQLDGVLTIAAAFAAGRMTERQLHEQTNDRGSNVVDLDQTRATTSPAPPEGWKQPREYGSS